MNYGVISAEEFTALTQTDPMLDVIDVRSDLEYQAYRLEYPVKHIPLHEIDMDALVAERAATDKPLYVLCKAGPRAEKLCQLLCAFGQDDVVVVQGGVTGCMECACACEKAESQPDMSDIQAAVQDSVQKFIQKFGG